MPTESVQAGQLISSSLMNEILERLKKVEGGSTGEQTSLEPRVQALEAKIDSMGTMQAEEKVRISGFDPPGGAAIGQVMTILGDNFVPDFQQNVVLIDNIPVYEFRIDSTASQLRVIVPNVPNAPSSGSKDISVSVSNTYGKAQTNYKLLPASVDPAQIAVIDGISPHTLYIGESFIVTGLNLGTLDKGGIKLHDISIAFVLMTKFGPMRYIVPEGDLRNASANSSQYGKPNKEAGGKVPDIMEINLTQDDKDATDVVLEAVTNITPSAMRMVRVRRKY